MQRLPLMRIGNTETPAGAFARAGTSPLGVTDGSLYAHPHQPPGGAINARHGQRMGAPPDTLCRANVERLLAERHLSPPLLSTEALKRLRQEILAAANADKTLTAGEQSCLVAGLNLELLKRPGVWNESSGDLQSLIVNVADWPQGRALRIVDADHDAIHLYRPGLPEQCHRGNDPELPSAQDDEIILLRHGNHFSLIRRDRDNVVQDVPADGDCFFSCISAALQAEDNAASNLHLRRQLADLVWNSPELLQVASAHDGALAPVLPPQHACIDETLDAGPVADPPRLTAKLVAFALEGYRAEMARILAEDVLSPRILLATHEKLAEATMAGLHGIVSDPRSPQLDLLRTGLDAAFASYRQQNAEAIKTRQLNITRAQQKAMSAYMEQIGEVLAQQPTSMALQADHRRIRAEVEAELITDIRTHIRESEPVEGHRDALGAEIDYYWLEVVLPEAEKARRQRADPAAVAL